MNESIIKIKKQINKVLEGYTEEEHDTLGKMASGIMRDRILTYGLTPTYFNEPINSQQFESCVIQAMLKKI